MKKTNSEYHSLHKGLCNEPLGSGLETELQNPHPASFVGEDGNFITAEEFETLYAGYADRFRDDDE